MINIEKHEIEFSCPNCGFYNPIYLKQAKYRDVIICRGCKINIRLDDQLNECKNAIRSINRDFTELTNSFKNLELKINF